MEIPVEVKEYFEKGRRTVKKVVAQKNFTLKITFDNDEIKVYDMKETLKGKVFTPIKEWNRFKDVYIDIAIPLLISDISAMAKPITNIVNANRIYSV
jgi:ribosomal protein S9